MATVISPVAEVCRSAKRAAAALAQIDTAVKDAALEAIAAALDDGQARPLAKGICNYSAQELRQVIGMKSAAVREILPRASEEAVHRDYLVLD